MYTTTLTVKHGDINFTVRFRQGSKHEPETEWVDTRRNLGILPGVVLLASLAGLPGPSGRLDSWVQDLNPALAVAATHGLDAWTIEFDVPAAADDHLVPIGTLLLAGPDQWVGLELPQSCIPLAMPRTHGSFVVEHAVLCAFQHPGGCHIVFMSVSQAGGPSVLLCSPPEDSGGQPAVGNGAMARLVIKASPALLSRQSLHCRPKR